MNLDVQQAINAEKRFNNKNSLLVTYYDRELRENSFKELHRSVQNVYVLQPEFVPKIRYILELKDSSEADKVKDAVLRNHYGKGYLTINLMDHFSENYMHIDPYKLHIKNLPISMTDRDIKQLYPLCTQYNYIKSDNTNSKSILAHFNNVKDAISAYNVTNKIIVRSNNLSVQFYRDKSKAVDEYHDEEDSEDDISKWEQMENNCLKNKAISDTLLIKNFPVDTTGPELLKLYPECCNYKFIYDISSKSKTAVVRFKKVEDAVNMYTESNNIYKSKALHMEFYYKDMDKKYKIKSETKTNKGVATENIREENVNEERSQNNSNLDHFESKLNEKGINSKNVDSCVLHVENLPLAATNEDLLELFPEHHQYQIILEKSTNSSSAFVCFHNPFATLQAFEDTNNKLYKRRMLTVKFKSKKLKINPFALLKRKETNIDNNKRIKLSNSLNTSSENDDVILIEELTNNQQKIISEDDIEHKSEDEEYPEDTYGGIELEDEFDNEDNMSEENDFQGIILDDDTLLPVDEDDFNFF